ncbi:hypothetical protein [Mycobacterium sp. 852002-40037_SCH5390672]|uniref:hypothetical protein n=1 Tax=Mycobacterium sp. 852002-40037_SCH5390672 TaxID=1834089 RepID=UPI000805FE03|nr:hypothetical protein [Mycobacterium sp. 852002-40037_SCH5390672]OBB94648.1 hypothetical protein A5782_09065 [Mycobacterium sp. 852002-40037_SCH5390672]
MITVMEKWFLRPNMNRWGLEIMQQMDELVGPAAHVNPGWAGHARFYQSRSAPSELLMVYPWRTLPEHRDLATTEEPLLADIYHQYCSARRKILYFDELPVEVEHGQL